MCRLKNPFYRGYPEPEPERTFRLLRRFQAIGHLPGSPPHFLVLDIEEEPTQAYIVMADNDIIDNANDMAHKIRDYSLFDPNYMKTIIIRPEITVTQFKFEPMMLQILQAIG